VPNPFSEQSVIHYVIPSEAKNVSVILNDANGKVVRIFNNLSPASGFVRIQSESLPAGTFSLSVYNSRRKSAFEPLFWIIT
jgi:hypothetical protein